MTEMILMLLWFFLFLMVVWLLTDYLELSNLRRWVGWLGRRRF